VTEHQGGTCTVIPKIFQWQLKVHNLCPIQTSFMHSGRKMCSVEAV